MRVIKFRVWDDSDEAMHAWKDLSTYLYRDILFSALYGEHYCTTSKRQVFIPMQYIGIEDKDGEEIYEGDIIVGYCDNHAVTDIRVIDWFDGEGMGTYGGWNFPDVEEVKVLGNVYENPELLEGANANV